MTLPFDCCRLYLHLRSRAYAEPTESADAAGGRLGVVDIDEGFEDVAVGLDHEHAMAALDALRAASLVRPLRDDERRVSGIGDDEGHETVFVEPFDDLTAATILLMAN